MALPSFSNSGFNEVLHHAAGPGSPSCMKSPGSGANGRLLLGPFIGQLVGRRVGSTAALAAGQADGRRKKE